VRYLRAALLRIAGLFAGPRADAELREEFESHLELHTAENIRRGMTPTEARRQALVASGGLAIATEEVRDRRGQNPVDTIRAD
jgi:hypothetical protein